MAVTGIGLVTPLGADAPSSWARLVDGASGVRLLGEDVLPPYLPSRIAAVVPRVGGDGGGGHGDGEYDADGRRLFDAKRWLNNPRAQDPGFIAFAMAAASEALADAGWLQEEGMGADAVRDDARRDRTGVAIGTGIGSIQDTVAASALLAEGGRRGFRRLSPFFVPRILGNLAAGHVSMAHGLRGPNHAAATACATGAHGVGDAFRLIARGDADVMLAGGTEASVAPLAFAGFCRLKALCTADAFHADDAAAQRASRPFDRDRCGFVMGEGAGVLVLEELGHARARGARVYAEVRGYGLSGDAHHMTAPHADGRGAAACMRAALREAGLAPAHVGYVNAHATSTPQGDNVEQRAIASLFGGGGDDGGGGGGGSGSVPAVSSTKGATGHLLGAAGAVEAAFTVLALHHGVLPPTLNLDAADDEFAGPGHDYVPRVARREPGLRAAMCNSFGFGGTNASLVFAEPPPQ